jgi:hypothetical protein
MSKTDPAPADPANVDLPQGGMWERQRVFGGARLQQTFAALEPFILYGIAAVGEVPLDGDNSAPKTELIVARIDDPDDRFSVNTLSGPINEMATEAKDSDFPVEVYWEQVPTKRELSDATVLTAIRKL